MSATRLLAPVRGSVVAAKVSVQCMMKCEMGVGVCVCAEDWMSGEEQGKRRVKGSERNVRTENVERRVDVCVCVREREREREREGRGRGVLWQW